MTLTSTIRIAALLMVAIFIPRESTSLRANIDANIVDPVSDGGKYITVEQSKTLYPWGYNLGFYTHYGFEPVEVIRRSTGGRLRGVVDDLWMGHVVGALGILEWWQWGVDIPIALYESFVDPECPVTGADCPREKLKFKFGDIRVLTKFRLLDIDRYTVGIGFAPFIKIPSGNSRTFAGHEQFTGGGKIIVDLKMGRRLSAALNVGYQILKEVRYDPRTPNAKINDLFLGSAALHYSLTNSIGLLGEVYSETLLESFYKYGIQSPIEFLAGVRYTPQQFWKGFGITLAGGRGLRQGFGATDWRAFAGINYRHSEIVELPPPPAPVELEPVYEEKILITQKIHFEFDRWVIRPISYPILDDVAEILKKNPQIKKILVEGHTDSLGSDVYNLKLSDRRARSVLDYLVKRGISLGRLASKGFGESKSIMTNDTTEGRAKNRRTEFTVLESSE